MANAHRTNVLVTSCLKTPVDPHTRAPLASYERERVLPYTATGHMDNRDYEKEVKTIKVTLLSVNVGVQRHRLDLSEIFFSNEEYYSKLEELKKAHLRTMAELESMYRQKLQLKSTEPFDMAKLDVGHRWVSFGWHYTRNAKCIVLSSFSLWYSMVLIDMIQQTIVILILYSLWGMLSPYLVTQRVSSTK
uniref:Uncharacterized protein n=1 Tax=Amphiprion ocellaris TaxID=80972 RepID=A0AAQ5WZ60_AMPOC